MSTTKDDTFDYQAYMKNDAPDTSKIKRGAGARKKRFEAAKMKFTIRIDEDILEQFQQLTSPGEECEKLINQILREWLIAKNMKELVREELKQLLQQTLSSSHVRA